MKNKKSNGKSWCNTPSVCVDLTEGAAGVYCPSLILGHFNTLFSKWLNNISSHLGQQMAAAISSYRWVSHRWGRAGRTPCSDSWFQREPQWTGIRNLWPPSHSPLHCPHRSLACGPVRETRQVKIYVKMEFHMQKNPNHQDHCLLTSFPHRPTLKRWKYFRPLLVKRGLLWKPVTLARGEKS